MWYNIAMRTRSTIKNLVHSKLSQASLSISDSTLNNSLNSALDQFLLLVDIPQAEKKQNITLFNEVSYYPAPTDFNGIIELRPFISSRYSDLSLDLSQSPVFDQQYLNGNNHIFGVEYTGENKELRINITTTGENLVLDDFETAWTGTTSDNINYTTGSKSIKWSSSSEITHAITSKDISSYLNPYLFIDVYIPSDTTQVIVKIGNNASNYYTFTATAGYSKSFVAGWNTIGVSFEDKIETGTVDETDIDYLAITIDGTGTRRADNLVIREGNIFEMKYISNKVVKTSAGVYNQHFSADDDTLIFDSDLESVFIDFVASYIAPNAEVNGSTFYDMAMLGLRNYLSRKPSKRKKTIRQYYAT